MPESIRTLIVRGDFMENAIARSGVEHPRQLSSKLMFGTSAESAAVQTSLFEQILSLPTNITTSVERADDLPASSAYSDTDSATSGQTEDAESQDADVESDSNDAPPEIAATAVVAPVTQPDTAQSVSDSSDRPVAGPTSEASAATSEQPSDFQQRSSDQPVVEATGPANQPDGEQTPVSTLPDTQSAQDAESPAAPSVDADSPVVLHRETTDAPTRQARDAESPETALPADAEVSVAENSRETAAIDEANEGEQLAAESAANVPSSERESHSRRTGDRRLKWFEGDARGGPTATGNPQPNEATSRPVEPAIPPQESVSEPTAIAQPTPEKRADLEQALHHTETIHNIVASSTEPLTEPVAASRSKTSETAAAVTTRPTSGAVQRGSRAEASTAAKIEQQHTPEGTLPQADRLRLIQRISRSFSRLGPTGGQINLKLHPPELGVLNVQVRLEGRDMAAKLTTENAAAREAILENLPMLRGRLAEQGFDISSFQVELADSNSDAATGQQQPATDSDNQPFRRHSRSTPDTFVGVGAADDGGEAAGGPVLSWFAGSGVDIQA